MADTDFLTRAEAQTQLSQQIGLYDDGTGTTDTDKLDVDLETARNEIWAAIKHYDIYDANKDFDYATKISGTRSEDLLKGYCLVLVRYYAYMNSQQAQVPDTVKSEFERVQAILKGGVNLPDILLLKATGDEPDGTLIVYKDTARFRKTDLKDW